MKVAVIVAVALLALAQGKESPAAVGSEVTNAIFIKLFPFFFLFNPAGSFGQEASEVEKLGQYIDTLKTQILSSVNAQ